MHDQHYEKSTVSCQNIDSCLSYSLSYSIRRNSGYSALDQAEAMELELRYTLESFEGQLSAMAREKVAIQKQVKELTGQCSTLRRQVGRR